MEVFYGSFNHRGLAVFKRMSKADVLRYSSGAVQQREEKPNRTRDQTEKLEKFHLGKSIKCDAQQNAQAGRQECRPRKRGDVDFENRLIFRWSQHLFIFVRS